MIRVPCYANPEPLVFTFKTSPQRHVTAVAALVSKLYDGRPVGSAAVGKKHGMQHRQTLKYLHAAKEAGLVKPVYSGPGGVIRGWVPAHAGCDETVIDAKLRRLTAALKSLHAKSNRPVSMVALAEQLDVSRATVQRLIAVAEARGLVRLSRSPWGWLPA